VQNYNIKSPNNENLYGVANNLYNELIQNISNYIQCNTDNILLSSGSRQRLQLILKTFCNDKTNILIPVPNYNGFIYDVHLTSYNVKEIYFDNSDILDIEKIIMNK
jgi:DNA-binding transcriptional MocR family regulator